MRAGGGALRGSNYVIGDQSDSSTEVWDALQFYQPS